MLDRSPCGSGTAAIVTSNWYRGDFKIGSYKLLNLYLVVFCQYLFAHTHHIYWYITIVVGDTFKNKSIVGSEFTATVKETGPKVGPYNTGNVCFDLIPLNVITLLIADSYTSW